MPKEHKGGNSPLRVKKLLGKEEYDKRKKAFDERQEKIKKGEVAPPLLAEEREKQAQEAVVEGRKKEAQEQQEAEEKAAQRPARPEEPQSPSKAEPKKVPPNTPSSKAPERK